MRFTLKHILEDEPRIHRNYYFQHFRESCPLSGPLYGSGFMVYGMEMAMASPLQHVLDNKSLPAMGLIIKRWRLRSDSVYN
jgi:hypothetical protein